MNVESHLKSAKACERLAGAYLKNGEKELAVEYYKKARERDSSSASSVEMQNLELILSRP